LIGQVIGPAAAAWSAGYVPMPLCRLLHLALSRQDETIHDATWHICTVGKFTATRRDFVRRSYIASASGRVVNSEISIIQDNTRCRGSGFWLQFLTFFG